MPPDPLIAALLSRIRFLEDQCAPHPLVALIWATMRGPFFASDVMAEAARQAEAAREIGQALPDLPRLLSEAGLTNARKLGLWLGRNAFQIVSQEGGKAIWVIKNT